MREWLRSLAVGYLDLLFAPVCLGCRALIPTGAEERLVCRVCWTRLRPIPQPRCARCWMPKRPAISASLAPEGCATCDGLPAHVRALRSLCVLEGPAHHLAHGLKYAGWSCLAEPLGVRMARVPLGEEAESEIRTVIPVPLSGDRLRERGYNQAGVIARWWLGSGGGNVDRICSGGFVRPAPRRPCIPRRGWLT